MPLCHAFSQDLIYMDSKISTTTSQNPSAPRKTLSSYPALPSLDRRVVLPA